MMKYMLFVAFLLLLWSKIGRRVECDSSYSYHFTFAPDRGTQSQCRDRSCFTLDEYVQGHSSSHSYFLSNTITHFLPGTHKVSDQVLFIVRDVANVSLIGAGHGDWELSTPVRIHCEGKLGFMFANVTGILISGIAFHECGLIEQSETFLSMGMDLVWWPWRPAALTLVNVWSATLERVLLQDSYGYALFALNLLGHSNITGLEILYTEAHWSPASMNNSDLFQQLQSGNITQLLRGNGSALLMYLDGRIHSFESQNGLQQQSLHVTNASLKSTASVSCYHNFPITVLLMQCSYSMNIKIYGFTSVRESGIFVNDYGWVGNSIDIRNSQFTEGVDGVVLHFSNTSSPPVCNNERNTAVMVALPYNNTSLVTILNCSFWRNSRISLWISLVQRIPYISRTIRVEDCTFSENYHQHWHGDDNMHGIATLQIDVGQNRKDNIGQSLYKHTAVKISKVLFIGNKICALKVNGYVLLPTGGAFGYRFTSYPKYGMYIFILLTDCTVKNNEATNHGSLISLNQMCSFKPQSPFDIIHIEIENLLIQQNAVPMAKSSSVTSVCCITMVTITNSTISNNTGTALLATESIVTFGGKNTFISNSGLNGGALALEQSSMSFKPHTHLYLYGNCAKQYGGAIYSTCPFPQLLLIEKYISSKDIRIEMCSFQMFSWRGSEAEVVVMEDNTAVLAGDSIYGGKWSKCSLNVHNNQIGDEVFHSLFTIRSKHSLSEIASAPYKLCFCTPNSINCSRQQEVVVYPGETFHVPAVAVGQFEGASPATVRSVLHATQLSLHGDLDVGQRLQLLGRTCGNLTYSIRSRKTALKIHATLDNKSEPTYVIHANLRPCPFGFELTGEPPICDCARFVRIHHLQCDINSQKVLRPADKWIGVIGNISCIILHNHCPFDYCKPTSVYINLSSPNEQCAFNHSGILCGGCQRGHSLALGSSQCLHCSNVYMLLFIPFLLAGVALVFLLLKCNLNVSVGTINGLIFYANIVWVNRSVFFPSENESFYSQLLITFVAWLNLDLGIEICLFDGMDAYVRTWLQFAFPVYIWLLVGLMIISSRYSPTISRLTGSNAVPALATLLLLSYAKLLRTIIAAMSCTYLNYPNSSAHEILWAHDGNIRCFGPRHTVLFIAAFTFTVAYIIPFTLLVLFAPCIQAKSRYRLLKRINRLKPLLDAYQGPYKDRFRYWTGIMLLLRVGLFVIFGSNTTNDPGVNLVAIITAVLLLLLFCWNVGRVYKRFLLNIMESFFIANVGILAAITLFLKSSHPASPNKQVAITYFSLTPTVITFCLILAYHCYSNVQLARALAQSCKKCFWAAVSYYGNWRNNLQPVADENEDVQLSESAVALQMHAPTTTVVDLSQLREPLLSA